MKLVMATVSILIIASAVSFGHGLKLVIQKTDSGYFEGEPSILVDLLVVNDSTRPILLTESSCSYFNSLQLNVRGGHMIKWYCDANYPMFFTINPKCTVSYRVIISSNSDSLIGKGFVLGYTPIQKRLKEKKWSYSPVIFSDSIWFPTEVPKDSFSLGSLPPKIRTSSP